MDQRILLRNELDAIITASRSFVKRLRDRNAHILAAQITNIGMRSRKLKTRHDLLLPTYRVQVGRLLTLKVSITLPAHEWLFIDDSIKNGSALSRSEYFRKLFMSKKRKLSK
ncbi:hypothetical protein [Gorillibacterium sp. sgz500922]|uniref:hypothetical protein n=1 Tax=Gorillibacterium sp. sgz500922 TaxID=3446694 RepID=UPI003F66E702